MGNMKAKNSGLKVSAIGFATKSPRAGTTSKENRSLLQKI